MNKTQQNSYDVNSYTDDELYNILDLIKPSDRELEAKTISMIRRYSNMQTGSGDQLAKFFQDIYDHFFDGEEEAMENMSEDMSEDGEPITEGLTNDGTTADDAKYVIKSNVDLSKLFDDQKKEEKPQESQVSFTKSQEYAQEKLNPLLQQTIKRIVSIDSQYRDDKTVMSTNFSFNLSEPLKDVVSLKLYSIQIPQTWYTVSNAYGCNFFYIKGSSPGIDNGYHDYIIDISAGNYTASTLITALNTSIQNIKIKTPDVSFGQTSIGYNPNAALATTTVEFNTIYNESSYYMYFPTWTSSIGDQSRNGPRYSSIPGYFGFNFRNYYLNATRSVANLPYTTNATAITSDNVNGSYLVDNSNNYFTIYKYIGPDEYSSNSVIDLSFQIKLSVSGVVTRTQLVNDLSNQLTNNTYLSGSTVKRIDITDASSNGYGYSYFQLQIKYNRSTTNNIKNSKTYVELPTEISSIQYFNVWTGKTSCFRFQKTQNELNEVVSQSSSIQQGTSSISILNRPYIYLNCVKANYNVDENDYQITIQNSTVAGYSYTEFIASINLAIATTSQTTITTTNIVGDFNLQNFTAYIDSNSKFNLQVDFNKNFTQDMYYIDLSGTFLQTFIGLSGEYLNGISDLSGSPYTFNSSFPQNSQYFLDSNTILLAYPSNSNYGNQNAPYFTVYSGGEGIIYSRYQDVQTAINNAFEEFTDEDGVNIFSGTNIEMDPNDITGYIDCVFSIRMKKTITQLDYNLSFIDVASSKDEDGNIIANSSSWSNNLKVAYSFLGTTLDGTNGYLDGGYDLSNIDTGIYSYTKITSPEAIVFNTINFIDGVNNFFYLIPYEEGVATGRPYYVKDNQANDLKITVPAIGTDGRTIFYTRDQLISTINVVLYSSELTRGSSISVVSINNNFFTKIRITVNKRYTASDYKIVFYDQLSFVKCFTGATSIQNTTWDTTLGWLLGYHGATEYFLSDYGTVGNPVSIVGETTVSVNLFDYFLLCLDDYNQNHLNDGLVTVTTAERDISLPSYANKADYTCDPTSGFITYNVNATTTNDNKLTQNQLYSLTQIANNKRTSSIISSTKTINAKSYGTGPFVKDVFGYIPMKTAGLAPGSVYVDYGGTLQNQERAYFGPVNINRMAVKLVSNRGDIVDLNGSDWSFSLIAEQLYQQKPKIDKKDAGKK
jgi:hypothetical protein